MIAEITRFTIGKQIIAGFVLILALLAGLALYSYLAVTDMKDDFDRSNDVSALFDKANKAQIEVERASRAIATFTGSRTLDAANLARMRVASAVAAATALDTALVDPAQKAAFAEALAAGGLLTSGFEFYTDLLETLLRQINDDMFKRGDRTTKMFADVLAAQSDDKIGRAFQELQIAFTQAQTLVNRWLFGEAPGDLEQARAALDRTVELLGRMPSSDADAALDKIDAEVGAYRNAFAKAVLDIDGLHLAEKERMGANARKIGDAILSLWTLFRDNQKAEDQRFKAVVERVTLTLPIATAIAVALGIAIAIAIASALSRPIRRVTRIAETLAGGNSAVDVPVARRADEVGQLMTAMGSLRATVAEAFRLKQMVDDMPTPSITADASSGLAINYLNKEAEALLQGLSAHLPIAGGALAGSSITALHPTLAAHAADLADPARLPWRAKITIGPETLDLRASAVHDRAGLYLGPMLTLTVITAQMRLADGFERDVISVAESVASSSGDVQINARAVSAAAEDASRQTTLVASAAEEASSNLQTISTAAEELASSISEIGRQIEIASSATSKAVQETEQTDKAVESLAETAAKVSRVVDLITEIAAQTNLLALNATIEAARAGDAGKGFAIVASEVKNLANQTAKATEEIGAQIDEMQSATTAAVSAIRGIGKTVSAVNEIAGAIAAAVTEQSAATAEIARNVEQAARGTEDVSRTIVDVSRATSATGDAAGQLLEASSGLNEQAATLRREVDTFLLEVRAG